MGKQNAAARFDELAASAKDEVTRPAGDILAQIYAALLALPEIKLADGTTARIEAYFPPQLDDDGQQHCGIDVRLDNGHSLEFTLRNTGWEKAFAPQIVASRAATQRKR